MGKLDLILNEIFSSEDYRTKGTAVQSVESFFARMGEICYLVLVMRKSSRTGARYAYALYSLTEGKYIPEHTTLFQQLTGGFPSLETLDENGGAADFMEVLRLGELFEELLETVSISGTLAGQAAVQYGFYLEDMKKMRSASVQVLYEYFSKLI